MKKRAWWRVGAPDETPVLVTIRIPALLAREARLEAVRQECSLAALLCDAIVTKANRLGLTDPPASAA